MNMLEKKHPHEPHYYLASLGTDPAHQRKGFGASVMEPVLSRCDGEGVGAYLESSKEENVRYYRRFGFEVREEVVHKHDGPRQWLMWRDPR
jgi:ribosomal protein S18 acetylase RimI-like enzyme